MKLLNKRINELRQSQKKEMGEKGLLWMALFLAVTGSTYLLLTLLVDDFLDGIIFRYLAVAFYFLSLLSITSYLYIYSKKKLPDRGKKAVIFFYKILVATCFVICIPLMIFLKILGSILNYRARKLDNLINWLIILVLDMLVVMALVYFDILLAEFMANLISCFTMSQWGSGVSTDSVALFLELVLFKVEMDITNGIILKIINYYRMSRIQNKIKQMQKDKMENMSPYADIREYINKKNEEIEIFRKEQIDDLKYDLDYQKKTIWKFQLICLIIIFLIAAFVPDFLFENQSDTINVITIFTLIMLFIDKRKEWK